MPSRNGILFSAALAMLAFVCHAPIGSDADDDRATTQTITFVDANSRDTASIPDFDGDGTIGFGDFVIFAGVFGARQGDEKYLARYDLNGDGEIGFSDFVIFAQNFGKDVPSPVVTIPDAHLRAVIEAALGKDSGAPITQAEMATLDSLDASEADVSVLTGLEFAANLTYLSLNDNDIKDISALAKLTSLTRLWLSNNSIEDISVLSKLTNLTELWLWNNQIEDISPLSGLTNLTRLSLGRNNITDVSALAGLTNLKTIILTGNDISDLAPLAANKGLGAGGTVDVTDNPLNPASHSTHVPALQARGVLVSFVPSPAVAIPDANLRAAIAAALGKASGAPITQADMAAITYLEARRTEIRDLTGIEFATNLTGLNLALNSITDISSLSGLPKLTWLDLGYNGITDISSLSGLTDLTSLTLYNNILTDISSLSGLTNLASLHLGGNSIADISSLSGLTNLTSLTLGGNSITDISSLSGLSKLTLLELSGNSITDISVLSGLTNLRRLNLVGCSITDISSLSGLSKLTWLHLGYNSIKDITPLSGLSKLTFLYLLINKITDISSLSGLSQLIELNLRGNPLSGSSINDHIPALESGGVTVLSGSFRQGDFDIDLVFLDEFNEPQKNALRYVARRWMAVIAEDLPDYEFNQGWSGRCGDQSFTIPAGEQIDDLRIYVTIFDGGPRAPAGMGSPRLLRESTYLPVLGCMQLNSRSLGGDFLALAVHEAGHVLGFGTRIWNQLGYSQNPPDGDLHFNGPLAIGAFDAVGGRDYSGAKVPLDKKDGSHWRRSVFGDEVMGGGGPLSAITVQSLADLGYGVDVTQADSFTLPRATSGSKIAVSTPAVPGFDLNANRPDVYTLSGAKPYGPSRLGGLQYEIIGDDGSARRLESAVRMWGGTTNFNLKGDRQTWPVALPSLPAPELTCGAGLMNEPIYVVDPQGRIVRTISR